MTSTRPDIAYALNNCARHIANASQDHLKALDRIWQYLLGTKNLGLYYKDIAQPKLIGYSDFNWARETILLEYLLSATYLPWETLIIAE